MITAGPGMGPGMGPPGMMPQTGQLLMVELQIY